MGLTVGMCNIADIRIQGVTLRSIFGAYELLFGLYISTTAPHESSTSALIAGAEVTVRLAGGANSVGFARPDIPIKIQTSKFSQTLTPVLRIGLDTRQLSTINELRGDGDVDFELLAKGEGRDSQTSYGVQDTWRYHIPRSSWLEELRRCGAMDVLLFEVPLATDGAAALRAAYKHFVSGDYQACVAQCRTAIQEIGQNKFGKSEWASDYLRQLGAGRDMTKDEREAAIMACIRHYTNQAHHTEAEGGIIVYTRSDARLILIFAAALHGRWTRTE